MLGSCVALTSPGGVPDAFELSLDRAVSSRKCHVIWRSEDKLGVSFGDAVIGPVETPYLTLGLSHRVPPP